MKNSILSKILSFITSMFLPLYDAAERKFTLGIVTSIGTATKDSAGTSAAGMGASINVNLNQGAVIDRSSDPVIDTMSASNSTPSTLQQTISSAAGSGAETITAYFLNEDVYFATPSTNGATAANVTDAYSDGFAGSGYNNLAKSVNQGRGIMVYGLTMVYKTISTGTQDPNALAGSEVQLVTSVLVGNKQRPDPSPLNEGVNAANFKDGTMTVLKKFFLSSINQISYQVPADTQSTMIVLCKPQAGQ